MKLICSYIFLVILSLVSSCGVYVSDCKDILLTDYSIQSQAYVVCDEQGFSTKIEYTQNYYVNKECEGDIVGELTSLYNTVKSESATDKNDAEYTATYVSALFKTENAELLNSKVTCVPVLEEGVDYDLKNIECRWNMIDIFDKSDLGKEMLISVKYTSTTAFFTGISLQLFTKKTEVAHQPFEWYMIRNGYLGPEYSSKIVSAVLSIIIILYDCLTRKRLDYFSTFIVGTVLWIVLEWALLKSGVREYQVGYLRGKELGFWAALIIRCMQECGFLMVVSMFDGDRLCDCLKGKQARPSRCRSFIELAVVFILLSVSAVSNMLSGKKEFRAVGSPDVAGRRNMTHPVSVALFCGMTVACIVFVIIYRNKKYFLRRTIGQTIFITWTTGLGMLIEFFCNARWVEVGHYPEFIAMPSGGHEFLAFMYDLIIEVIIPPIFIYFVLVVCRIVPDFRRDSYYDEERPTKKTLPVVKEQPNPQPAIPIAIEL